MFFSRPAAIPDFGNRRPNPTAHSAPLTRASREEEAEEGDPSQPTLGPVTERFVVVSRGEDVVLECRDADDNWVYWKKMGGE